MNTTTTSVPNLTDLRKILQEHKDELYQQFGVTHVGLFGSYAREEATSTSDIDIVVEIENPDLFIMAALKTYLEELLHHPVDVIRLRQQMNPLLKQRIEHDALYV